MEALQAGAKNNSVLLTILTGVGKTYSSGTDFSDLSDKSIEERLIVLR